MVIVAKGIKGKEFFYKAQTAHKVPERNAQKVADILNACGYRFQDGETWHVYNVDEYDNAYYYAEGQRFTYGKGGTVKRIAAYSF